MSFPHRQPLLYWRNSFCKELCNQQRDMENAINTLRAQEDETRDRRISGKIMACRVRALAKIWEVSRIWRSRDFYATIILYTKGFQPKTTGLMMFWFVPHHGSMDLPTGKAWVAVLPRKKHPKTLDWKRTAGTETQPPKMTKEVIFLHFPWSSIFGFFYLVSFGRYLSKLGTTRILQKKTVDVGGKQLEDSEPILLVLSNNLW